MQKRGGIGLVLMTSLAAAACDKSAIPRVSVGPGDGCSSCEILLEEVWTSNPQDSLVDDAGFAIESDGELWMGGGFMGSRLGVFDLSNGSSRSFGRNGDGPSEFGAVVSAHLVESDSVVAVIHSNRISRFSISSGVFLSTRNFEPTYASGSKSAPVGDGLALMERRRDAEVQGWVVPTVSGDPWPWSYGAVAEGADRFVAPSDQPSHVWVGETLDSGFRLSLISIERDSSTTVRTLDVDPEWWFRPNSPTWNERSGAPPIFGATPSRAVGLFDFGRHLIVLLQHPDRHFERWDREYWEPEKGLDSIFMALDAVTGEVLATYWHDNVAYPFTNRGRTPIYSADSNGFPAWSLQSVTLEGWR